MTKKKTSFSIQNSDSCLFSSTPEGAAKLPTMPSTTLTRSSRKATTSATSLTTLPPEILGRIGTYLDIFHHAAGSRNGRGDVSTFLSISRLFRNAAPHIQRAYLTNSVHYLHFCGSRDGVTARWRHDQFDALHTRGNLLRWMDINDRWRDAHKPYIAERPLPSLQADIVLSPIVTDADADRLESELLDASDHLTFEGMPPQLFRGADGKQVLDEDYPFDVVIGIDGTDVTSMPYDQVKELIMKRTGKEKKIRCLHSVFWCFFLNSAIAADLGLLDVLRNCVEQIGIDVNFVGRRGLRFNNVGMHLLTRALVNPDRRLFEYLMAQKSIKLNPEVNDNIFIPVFNNFFITLNRSRPLLHSLTSDVILDALDTSGSELDALRIKQLLDRPEVDVNEEDRHGHTPLWHIVNSGNKFTRNDLLIVKTFLDAGAETENIDLSELPDRRGYRGTLCKLIDAGSRPARDDIIASLRPLGKRKRV